MFHFEFSQRITSSSLFTAISVHLELWRESLSSASHLVRRFYKGAKEKKGPLMPSVTLWPFKHLARFARLTKKKKQTARSLLNLCQMEHVLHPIIHSLEDSEGFR